MNEKNGRWYLIGIVSAGYSCASRGQPGNILFKSLTNYYKSIFFEFQVYTIEFLTQWIGI